MLTLSYSRIDTYLRCPLAYYFKYEKGIEPEKVSPALVLGSAVHSTVAHFFRRHLAGRPLTTEELEKSFEEDWTARTTVPVKWNGVQPEDLEAQGLQLIKAYVDSIDGDVVTPIAVEQELRSPLVNPVTGETLPGVEILGYLDRLDADGTITELKTSSRSYSQFQCDTSLQADLYTYLISRHDGQEEVRCRYEVIVKLKSSPKVQLLETSRDLRHWDRMYRTIEQVYSTIQDRRFYPVRGYGCANCDFAKECHAW